jgi:N-acetylglucosamine kinase-like BadF-type ATPase
VKFVSVVFSSFERPAKLTKQIVIGVDGGGTSTRVALATHQGEVLGIGKAGAGNYHDVGVDAVRSNIDQALTQAWDKAGIPKQQADAVFLGLGSVASEEDRDTIRQVAEDLSLARSRNVGVDHDLRVALAGGLVGKPGIILIAGTGASCFGRADDGRTWRAGGWGPLLDDVGRSGWLGLQSMIAAVREFDGRGLPTVLSSRVLDALEIKNIDQILHRVDSEGLSRREMGALAKLVTQAAAEGDLVAQEIIAAGTDELAILIATVANKLDLADSVGTVPVAVTGGLTKAEGVFLDPLRIAVQRRAPTCEVIEPRLPPVMGSVLIALQSLGIAPSSEVVDNLVNWQAVRQ